MHGGSECVGTGVSISNGVNLTTIASTTTASGQVRLTCHILLRWTVTDSQLTSQDLVRCIFA